MTQRLFLLVGAIVTFSFSFVAGSVSAKGNDTHRYDAKQYKQQGRQVAKRNHHNRKYHYDKYSKSKSSKKYYKNNQHHRLSHHKRQYLKKNPAFYLDRHQGNAEKRHAKQQHSYKARYNHGSHRYSRLHSKKNYWKGHRHSGYKHRYYNKRHYYYNHVGFYFPDYGYIRHGHQHGRHCPDWHYKSFVSAAVLSAILVD